MQLGGHIPPPCPHDTVAIDGIAHLERETRRERHGERDTERETGRERERERERERDRQRGG